MNITAIDIQKVADAPARWQEIVDASIDGWIWHTWLAHEFNLCAGEKYGGRDLSFFVYEEGKAVGVVPLIVQKKILGEYTGYETAYYSESLPWPCFRADLEPERAAALENFAFIELERRAREAGAGRIAVLLIPPINRGDERERIARVAAEHSYLYLPMISQLVTVNSETLSLARSRYDYKHFSPLFTVTIAEGPEVTEALEETYFNLHVKDAGGQFRSRESYTKQADIARQGEGFYVIARHKEGNTMAGMILVSYYKGAAHYASAAIDPLFQKMCVGYQLQCRAIEELLHRGISFYNLGGKENISTWNSLASDKKRGIAHFKDKFARHQARDVYHMEKFLNAKFFDAYLQEKGKALRNYFSLQ